MDELAHILRRKYAGQHKDFSKCLFNTHMAVMTYSPNTKSDFITRFLGLLKKRPDEIPESDWEDLKMLGYTFIVMLRPGPENVRSLSYHVSNGPLFRTVLTLMFHQQKRGEQGLFNCSDLFESVLETSMADCERNSFYSLTPASYVIGLPSLFKPVMMKHPFIGYVHQFLKRVVKLDGQHLTHGQLCFIAEMYKTLCQCLNSDTASLYPADFINGLLKVVEVGSSLCPSSLLILFLQLWVLLTKTRSDLINVKPLTDNFATLTRLLEKTAMLKYHEVDRSFPWNALCCFYDVIVQDEHLLKQRTLTFVANCLRTIPRFEKLPRIQESAKCLVNHVTNFFTEAPFYTCFLLTSFESTIKAATALLNKVCGLGSINSRYQGSYVCHRRKMFFVDQLPLSMRSHKLDNYLTTTVTERSFSNRTEAGKFYYHTLMVSENSMSKIQSVALFERELAKKMQAWLCQDAERQTNTLTVLSHLVDMIGAFVDFAIEASLKHTEMTSWESEDFTPELEALGYMPKTWRTPKQIYQVPTIFKELYIVIDQIPKDCKVRIARDLADRLFCAMKTGKLTARFIYNLWILDKNHGTNYDEHMMFDLLLRKMLELAYEKSYLLMSKNAEDSELLHDWILFTIRTGSILHCQGINASFGTSLKIYQRAICNAVFHNFRSLTNQAISLKIVERYNEAVVMHYHESAQAGEGSPVRPVFPHADDIDICSKGDKLRIILSTLVKRSPRPVVHAIVPILEEAFKTNNRETIAAAAGVCVWIFNSDGTQSLLGQLSDAARRIFKNLFDAIRVLDTELARQVASLMPGYISLYLSSSQIPPVLSPVTVDGSRVDLFLLLTEISESLTDSDEEIAGLVTLLDRVFRGVVHRMVSTNSIVRTLALCINLLTHCAVFECVKGAVKTLAEFITKEFGDLFLTSQSCVYPLCLFAVIGKLRFKSGIYATDLAHMFFQYCAGKTADDFWVGQCIEALFWEFEPNVRVYGILAGFSFFMKYYPTQIKLDQLKNFLIQTTDVLWNDFVFARVLNKFLKEFLEVNEQSVCEEFVAMCYSIICPLSVSVRHVLEKRLFKLQIPLPVHSYREIMRTMDILLLYQRLTLAFLCGIRGDEEIGNDVRDRVVNLLNSSGNDHIPKSEKLARILSLGLAILRSPKVLNTLAVDHFFPHLTQIIFNSLLFHLRPAEKHAKKCIKLCYASPSNISKFLHQEDEYWQHPTKFFSFWEIQTDKPNWLRFFTRLTKLKPEKTPPEIITVFFQEAFSYLAKDNVEKMQQLQNFCFILKQLGVKPFISLPVVREIVLGPYKDKSYLETYVDMVLTLLRHEEIPFFATCRKSILVFLGVYAYQFLDYIIFRSKDAYGNGFFLAEQLILSDSGFLFFDTFLSIVDRELHRDVKNLQAGVFALVERLSNHPKYCAREGFQKFVEKTIQTVEQICHASQKRIDLQFELLSHIAASGINIAKAVIHVTKAQSGSIKYIGQSCLLMQFHYFDNSHLYRMIKDNLFTPEYEPAYAYLLAKLEAKRLASPSPKKVFRIILPHALKTARNMTTETIDSTWNLLFSLMDNSKTRDDFSVILLKSFRYALRLGRPSAHRLQTILTLDNGLRKWLLSPDPQIMVYALKLVIQLAEGDYLPNVIFNSLIQEFFTFQKFWSHPYHRYFSELIRVKREWMLKLPPETMAQAAFYIQEKYAKCEEAHKIILTLAPCAAFFKLLPYSLFMAMCSSLAWKLERQEEKAIMNEISLMVTDSQILDITDEERDRFVSLILKFVAAKLHSQAFCHDSLESFFQILVEKASHLFSISVVSNIGEGPMTRLAFSVVAVACRLCPDEMLSQHQSLIERAILVLKEEREYVPDVQVSYLCDLVFRDHQTVERFSPGFMEVCETLIRGSWRLSSQKRIKTLTQHIMGSSGDPDLRKKVVAWLEAAVRIMHAIPENHQFFVRLFTLMIKLLRHVVSVEQDMYWAFLLDRVKSDERNKKVFTSCVPSLLKANTISERLKLTIMDTFTETIVGNESMIMNVAASIEQFGRDARLDVLPHLVMVYLLLAKSRSCTTVSRAFEAIENILPESPHMRVQFAVRRMPILVWRNDYLPLIASTFTDTSSQVNIAWMSFAPRLSRIGASLFVSAMLPLVNDDLGNELCHLLVQALNQRDKTNYQAIIEGIIRLCEETERYLPAAILAKAVKRYTSTIPPEKMHSPDFVPDLRFMLPGTENDALFGVFGRHLSDTDSLAVALTCLDQYEAAKQLYDASDCSHPFTQQMRMVNAQFLRRDTETLAFDDIVKPLMKPGTSESEVLSLLKQAYEKFTVDAFSEVIPLLTKAETLNLDTFRAHPNPSRYAKEVFAATEAMILILRNKVKQIPSPNIVSGGGLAVLNPAFWRALSDFEKLIGKLPASPPLRINSDSVPSILVGPKMRKVLDCAAGVTSKGFIALGAPEINRYFQCVSQKIQEGSMTMPDWCGFAPFCFDVFCIQQDLSCFNLAFHAYCQILRTDDKTSFIRQQAGARIIALVRFAIERQGSSLIKPIQNAHLFGKDYAEVWRFWLQQLTVLSNTPWFFELAKPLFHEMTYRSTLYARKYCTKDVQDALLSLYARGSNRVQIQIMEKIGSFCKDILSVNIEGLLNLYQFRVFVSEALRLSDEEVEKIDLLEIRKKKIRVGSFENSTEFLTKSQIRAIGDFSRFVRRMRQSTDEERDRFLRECTGTGVLLSNHIADIQERVARFNNELPFIFPVRQDGTTQISIFRVNRDVSVLSPELMTFSATTSLESRHTFLVQKSRNPQGFRPSVMTIGTCLLLFKRILTFAYPSSYRNIQMPCLFSFELGENILLVPLPSQAFSMKNLFESDMMTTLAEWKAKHITNGKLNEKGMKSIRKFPTDSLNYRFLAAASRSEFTSVRTVGLASYASSSLMRFLFGVAYPSIDRAIACMRTGEIPIIASDFDVESFPETTSWSPIRLSPVICATLGPFFKEDFMLSLAAISSGLISHIESVRACLETILCDEIRSSAFSISALVANRTKLEQKLIDIAPPSSPGNTPEISREWRDGVINIIDKATNPWIQPIDAIPWY